MAVVVGISAKGTNRLRPGRTTAVMATLEAGDFVVIAGG
jgi:hypothetical protein